MENFEFLKNPLQVKFIPTLVALLCGVVAWAINGHFTSFILPAGLGAWVALRPDDKLPASAFWGFVLIAAAWLSYGTACLIYRVWGAAALCFLFGSFPLSIVFTREKRE